MFVKRTFRKYCKIDSKDKETTLKIADIAENVKINDLLLSEFGLNVNLSKSEF